MANINDYPRVRREYVCASNTCDYTTTDPHATCPWCLVRVVPERFRSTPPKRQTFHQHMLETLNLRGLNGWRCDVCGQEEADIASGKVGV